MIRFSTAIVLLLIGYMAITLLYSFYKDHFGEDNTVECSDQGILGDGWRLLHKQP